MSLLTQLQSDIDKSHAEPDKIKAKDALLEEIDKQNREMPFEVFRVIWKKHTNSLAEEAKISTKETKFRVSAPVPVTKSCHTSS
eukprot:SAG31_NODE_5478_length_2515_cov_38.661424_5_plen_84_part_00